MKRSKIAAGAVAAALSAFGLGLLGSTAHAVTPVANGMKVDQPAITLVARKVVRRHDRRVWVYNKRFGPRYRYRRAGYGYYYGGYWYARPWWTLGPAYGPYWGPGPGINLCIGC
ncbi:MAG: hypothetical protein ACJ8AS_00670 [Hyphomicrobiales bacterium]